MIECTLYYIMQNLVYFFKAQQSVNLPPSGNKITMITAVALSIQHKDILAEV